MVDALIGIMLLLLWVGLYLISASRIFPPRYRLPLHRGKKKREVGGGPLIGA